MGALEFRPSKGPQPTKARRLRVDALVDLASQILTQRGDLNVSIASADEEVLAELLRVGTSAGGARAKALIAWNPDTNEVRSGQVDAGSGLEYWILKFDGVASTRDERLSNPLGYGAIEYAYSLMAREAGIRMADCRILEEQDRRHFMTRRFDRTAEGNKLHMLSLGAMSHLDLNSAGAHGYEQALLTIRKLGLTTEAVEEQFRRMIFNVLARNQDDHVKNIAFLMDKAGTWSLAPAFDVIFAYNPSGDWTASHQMTINGKRDHVTLADFEAVAKGASMKRGRAAAIHEEVHAAVSRWSDFAEQAGVEERRAKGIGGALRLDLPR
jgi:serine/threonine-protein kinase HipA